MTNTRNAAEPMLTPGEIRTAPGVAGATVNVYSVAGGSFTHVRVDGADGWTLFSRSYQFETDALRCFADLKISG